MKRVCIFLVKADVENISLPLGVKRGEEYKETPAGPTVPLLVFHMRMIRAHFVALCTK